MRLQANETSRPESSSRIVAISWSTSFLALVEEREDDHGRMVEAVAHHELRLLQLLGDESRIHEVVLLAALRVALAVAPAERLLPHEHAHLVAEVEESLRLRVVRAAEEVAAHLLQVLDVGEHEALRRGGAELHLLVVSVRALEEDPLAVEVEPAVPRLDRADAEASHNGRDALLRVRRGRAGARPSQGDCVQVRRVRRPELEVWHLHRGAAVRESGLHLARAVKDERRVKVAVLEVDRLDLHRARTVVARAHKQLAVVESKRHAVVEPAPEVEVVE